MVPELPPYPCRSHGADLIEVLMDIIYCCHNGYGVVTVSTEDRPRSWAQNRRECLGVLVDAQVSSAGSFSNFHLRNRQVVSLY